MTTENKAFIEEVKHKWGESQLGCLGLPMSNEWKKAIKIIEEQEKNIERLKGALQFYADKETYKRWFSKSGEEFKTYPTNASIDIGFKARQALEAK